MTTQKYTGKTVEEATMSALEKLGLKREDVEVKVLNPGRGGVLGLGGEAAQIAVTVISDTQNSKDDPFFTRPKKDDSQVSFNDDVDDEIDEETEKLAIEIMNFFISSLGVSVKTYLVLVLKIFEDNLIHSTADSAEAESKLFFIHSFRKSLD